jgi:hypothetical protein
MSKLTLPAIPEGYAVQELPQQIYQELEGGFGAMRLDFIGGAARVVTVSWKTDRAGYAYLRSFYRTNIAQNCPVFQIDLVAHTGAVIEYDANFLPETMSLSGISGHTYSVQAQIEAVPASGESTSWPGTSFVLTLNPDATGYSVKDSNDIEGSRQQGPVGLYRRNLLNNSRRVTATWLCDATEYTYLCACERAHVEQGGKPFSIDLILDAATPTTHRAIIVPGTFGLASQGGTDSFTVNAQLEVEPIPMDETDYVLHIDPVPINDGSGGTGGPAIGWAASEGYSGAYVHSNNGVADWSGDGPYQFHCGVVDYVPGDVVVWSLNATGVVEGNSSIPGYISLTDIGNGEALIQISSGAGYPETFFLGIFTVSATINGVDVADIEMTGGGLFYSSIAWGPVP